MHLQRSYNKYPASKAGNMRHWRKGSVSVFQTEGMGSIPICRSIYSSIPIQAEEADRESVQCEFESRLEYHISECSSVCQSALRPITADSVAASAGVCKTLTEKHWWFEPTSADQFGEITLTARGRFAKPRVASKRRGGSNPLLSSICLIIPIW